LHIVFIVKLKINNIITEYNRVSVVKMRMLRWMSEVIREDRIRNEYLRGIISVVSIVDKMRENRLLMCG
jgi:hypothetical protein